MFFSLAVVVSAMQECTLVPHDSCTGLPWTYRSSTNAEAEEQLPCDDPDFSNFKWCPKKRSPVPERVDYVKDDAKWNKCVCAARCAESDLEDTLSFSGIACSDNQNHGATCPVKINQCDTTLYVSSEGTATCRNGAWTVTPRPSCELKAATVDERPPTMIFGMQSDQPAEPTNPAPTTTPTPTTIPATTRAPITGPAPGLTKFVLLALAAGTVGALSFGVVFYYFYFFGAKTTNLDGGRLQREKNYKKKSTTHADVHSIKHLGGEGGLGGEDDTAKYVKNLNGEDSEYMEYLISGVSLLAVLLIVGAFYRYFCFRNRSTASGAKE